MTTILDEIKHIVENKSFKKYTTLYFEDPIQLKAQEIKEPRHNLKLTQKRFAQLFGVSLRTVESWESGVNTPNGPSLRLMEIFKEQPQIAENFLIRKTVQEKGCCLLGMLYAQ